MKRISSSFLLTMICVSFATSSLAWNKPGHMLSAAIAYQVLQKENPQTFSRVRAILEQHPWFSTRWQKQFAGQAAGEQNLLLFMLAARWPDDARGTSFHHGKWHYINIPFKPSSEPEHIQADPPDNPNALEALKGNVNVLHNNTNPERRAVALDWLFHLVGDAHQPLHSSALFTTQYPDGDKGAMKFVSALHRTAPR